MYIDCDCEVDSQSDLTSISSFPQLDREHKAYSKSARASTKKRAATVTVTESHVNPVAKKMKK